MKCFKVESIVKSSLHDWLQFVMNELPFLMPVFVEEEPSIAI